MKKTSLLFLVLMLLSVVSVSAQRVTDKLSRGLVATPTSSGMFVSWRMLGEEYYDVKYNLYRNGQRIAQNLTVTNFTDASGSSNSKYKVAPVVRGVEQAACAEVQPWSSNMLTIPVAHPVDRDGNDVNGYYTLNDISLGDVDGDGLSEFIVKRPCSAASDPSQKKMFHQLDCYNAKGQRLWWIDLGPNMLSGADEQWDVVMYDWDEDGKAEVLLRIQDNAIIHHYTNGVETSTTNIGDMSVDTRWNGIEYTSSGNEYLLYLEGETGKPYQIGPASHPNYMDYPNPRGQDSDWGTGIIGHRSTKHYFGAPYLDGRHASIFLGRGAYTKHMMKAFDVDKVTHQLTQRWAWDSALSGAWFGQGYHNFAIGDVDWDGRDEIIFGSMVIDDNGKGLSTTGFGHGDAQHCSDFDPYRKYEEQFACNEDQPANNYRNAVTSELYYRLSGGGDDGRALMGNFTNAYPGSVGRSVGSGWVSSCADKIIDALGGDALISWGDLNQRIYWDGDLLDEYFDSPGTEGYGAIYKPAGAGRWNFPDSKCNNWSKNNPGAIGDILGDWREELVMRKSDNTAILVYTTQIPTSYGIPTLWSDHQYRNAMVWQSMGYNQPPHKSYFLGELENITQAPPTNTMTGRTEVANGGAITTTNEHLLVCETNNTNISITDGASPYMVTFNIPSWVQGNGASKTTVKTPAITYQYFTCTVSGGALTGATRVVKQGDGILTFPAVDMTYSGETNVWNGTFNLNGSIANSPLWLNRFAVVNTPAKSITVKSVKADYGSALNIGGANGLGEVTTDKVEMGFGSRISFDIYSDGFAADKLNTKSLSIEKKTWSFGPKYSIPVIEFVCHPAAGQENMAAGVYNLGKIEALTGSLSDLKIEGISTLKPVLSIDAENNLLLTLSGVRDAGDVVWTGAISNVWDYANTKNFASNDQTKSPDIFVAGDNVHFNDEAEKTTIQIQTGQEMEVDTIFFENASKRLTFNTAATSGIIKSGTLVKTGEGTVLVGGDNTYKGGNHIRGGVVQVSSLANSTQAYGNLGSTTTKSADFTIEDGGILRASAAVKNGSAIGVRSEGIIENTANFVQEKTIMGDTLVKQGGGYFEMQNTLDTKGLFVKGGTFALNSSYNKKTVVSGTAALTGNGFLATPIEVATGAKAKLTTVNRTTASSVLTGNGQITVLCATEKGSNYYATRTPIQFNMSKFGGTIDAGAVYTADGRFTFNTSSGNDSLTLNIPSGIIVQNHNFTMRLGQVTGTGDLGGYCTFANDGTTGTNTWNVGGVKDFTFAGRVIAADKFNKYGTGMMTVSGKWTTTGAVGIKGGVLYAKSGSNLGTGALTVDNGATLLGYSNSTVALAKSYPVTNSSVTVNGTLVSGTALTTSSRSVFCFGGKPLTINSTGTLRVGLRIPSTSSTDAKGSTVLSGDNSATSSISMHDGATVKVDLDASYNPATTIGTDEAKVDSFLIFLDFAKVSIGNIKYSLPELPENYTWDVSKFNTGFIYVRYKKSTDVTMISATEPVSVEVISTTGVKMANFKSVFSQVRGDFHNADVPEGIYILRIRDQKGNMNTMTVRK